MDIQTDVKRGIQTRRQREIYEEHIYKRANRVIHRRAYRRIETDGGRVSARTGGPTSRQTNRCFGNLERIVSPYDYVPAKIGMNLYGEFVQGSSNTGDSVQGDSSNYRRWAYRLNCRLTFRNIYIYIYIYIYYISPLVNIYTYLVLYTRVR